MAGRAAFVVKDSGGQKLAYSIREGARPAIDGAARQCPRSTMMLLRNAR